MVIEIAAKHVYKYPVEYVARTHLTKYPTEKEKFVLGVETLERNIDKTNGMDYLRRVAVCHNIIPQFMRKISVLNENNILLEEQVWLDHRKRQMRLRSRNLTWTAYARMTEESLYKVDAGNPKWTTLEQRGSIDISGLGILGTLLETFAHGFLHQGTQRAISIMEDLLDERSTGESHSAPNDFSSNQRFSTWV